MKSYHVVTSQGPKSVPGHVIGKHLLLHKPLDKGKKGKGWTITLKPLGRRIIHLPDLRLPEAKAAAKEMAKALYNLDLSPSTNDETWDEWQNRIMHQASDAIREWAGALQTWDLRLAMGLTPLPRLPLPTTPVVDHKRLDKHLK